MRRVGDIPFTYCHVPGSDCPVLLLPGLVGKDWIWKSTADELTREGYGTLVWNAAVAQLDLGEPTAAITELCEGALAMLDALSIERVLACGNSLGALLALEFAAHCPERTAGMVISGCPGLGEKVIDASYFLTHDEHQVVEEFRKQMFYTEPESLPTELIEEGMAMALHRPTTLKMLKVLRAADSYDTVESIGKVRCPTRLIWGDHDRTTPLESWMPHIEKFEDAELHVVAECGHSPMIEKTDEWLELLMDFVRKIIPGPDQDGALRGGTSAIRRG